MQGRGSRGVFVDRVGVTIRITRDGSLRGLVGDEAEVKGSDIVVIGKLGMWLAVMEILRRVFFSLSLFRFFFIGR